MGQWKQTGCICCAQNCGLRVLVENNRIVKVLPDKDNLRSEGYVCRKGLKIGHYQHHADRLTTPLKRVGDSFTQISWDEALGEIAAKLKGIVSDHGPRSFAYMGGGGQGCHFEAAFGVRLLRALGSRYHYNALGQELTGRYWAHGRAFGRQYLETGPDKRETDMLVAWGWNPWMSHQMPQARRVVKKFSDDPDKLLVVIDPRKSETAEKADIYVPLRPGTDALLLRAMIAVILQNGWQNKEYIAQHVSRLDDILPLLEDIDTAKAAQVCELDYDQVVDVSRLFASRKSSMHSDLGLLMNRHSTIASYLEVVLLTVCGRYGVPGGNIFPAYLMPLGSHSDERKADTWRTVATDFPAIMGVFPPNVMPEEIESDRPDRLRAVLVSGSNPLRSYADTTAYERAFAKLDLLVTVDTAMTETAALSHYVLPAGTAYEKWDGTFFAWTFPEIFFQMRRPVLEAEGDVREESEIFTELADRMGLLPDIPESLYDAAKGDRLQFGAALMTYAQTEPKAKAMLPFVLAKTLGPAVGSHSLAALWGLLQTAPKSFRENAARAGFNPGMTLGEEVFNAVVDNPQGARIGVCDPNDNLSVIQTDDKRINLYIPEIKDRVTDITPEREQEALRMDDAYPLVLMAGRHFDYNANTIMRDPAWNEGREASMMLMHPNDADRLSILDGQSARVVTEAADEDVIVSVTDSAREGHVVIPHGFGLVFQGRKHGPNVNRLTKNTNRDPIAATPLHRFVPCRVEPAGQ